MKRWRSCWNVTSSSMSRQKRHGKINIRYHDLKQQYSRATDEERARLEEEMDNLNLRYLTGNKALDITLTQKSALCGQAGIQLVCSADSSCLEDMKHYHIYSCWAMRWTMPLSV